MIGFPGRLRKSPAAMAAVGNVRVSGSGQLPLRCALEIGEEEEFVLDDRTADVPPYWF